MTSAEKAYAAGLFDGEGCIVISHRAQGQRGRVYGLRVQVCMSSEPTIQWLSQRFGGSCRPVNAPSRTGRGRKPVWVWAVNSRRAERFLCAIRPYMVTKAAEADVALAFQSRLTLAGVGRGGMSEAEHDVRLGMVDQLKALRHGDGQRFTVR